MLVAPSTAINWDGQPGSDGVPVKIYCFTRETAKAQPIVAGRVELLMYAGRPDATADSRPPLRRWVFAPEQLATRKRENLPGVSYQLRLAWQESPPASEVVTIVARHVSPAGVVVSSKPVTVVLAPV